MIVAPVSLDRPRTVVTEETRQRLREDIEAFAARQQAARERAAQRNAVPHATGQRFTGQPTRVEAFQLSHTRPRRIPREAAIHPSSPPSPTAASASLAGTTFAALASDSSPTYNTTSPLPPSPRNLPPARFADCAAAETLLRAPSPERLAERAVQSAEADAIAHLERRGRRPDPSGRATRARRSTSPRPDSKYVVGAAWNKYASEVAAMLARAEEQEDGGRSGDGDGEQGGATTAAGAGTTVGATTAGEGDESIPRMQSLADVSFATVPPPPLPPSVGPWSSSYDRHGPSSGTGAPEHVVGDQRSWDASAAPTYPASYPVPDGAYGAYGAEAAFAPAPEPSGWTLAAPPPPPPPLPHASYAPHVTYAPPAPPLAPYAQEGFVAGSGVESSAWTMEPPAATEFADVDRQFEAIQRQLALEAERRIAAFESGVVHHRPPAFYGGGNLDTHVASPRVGAGDVPLRTAASAVHRGSGVTSAMEAVAHAADLARRHAHPGIASAGVTVGRPMVSGVHEAPQPRWTRDGDEVRHGGPSRSDLFR